MGDADAAYSHERYRRLLAEADDEPKRLAFIKLLIEEKAKDRLADLRLRARLAKYEKAEDSSRPANS